MLALVSQTYYVRDAPNAPDISPLFNRVFQPILKLKLRLNIKASVLNSDRLLLGDRHSIRRNISECDLSQTAFCPATSCSSPAQITLCVESSQLCQELCKEDIYDGQPLPTRPEAASFRAEQLNWPFLMSCLHSGVL